VPRGDVRGAIYLISRTKSTKLKSYDACQSAAITAWRPDGRKILWFLSDGDTSSLFVSGADGRHRKELVPGNVNGGALWSPDGRLIAYGEGKNIVVLNPVPGPATSSVAVRSAPGHRTGKSSRPSRRTRSATAGGYAGGSVVAFRVTGNRSRVLITLPAVTTP
jgi:Tol biopolymer transport system component